MDKDLKHECPKCKGLFYQATICVKCMVFTKPLILKTESGAQLPCSGVLCAKELHLVREWFDGVQDLAPQYLESKDYLLARRIYKELDMRVPQSIIDGCA
ncbi:hypothetical protein KA005_04030 [bacterium]|nr:hypothetical protein [bacterium]